MSFNKEETTTLIVGTLIAILLRCCVSLHSYSGEGKPPMYGDYEAQRHWMEITFNLPMKQWYYNTTDNNLLYWGLDYPPLTAYHSYVCGLMAYYLNPKFVELHESRGFESDAHKFFMRYTVIIADVLLYIPAVILYFVWTRSAFTSEDCDQGLKQQERRPKIEDFVRKKKSKKSNKQNAKVEESAFPDNTKNGKALAIIVALLYPGLILIDHGHFQYNCISLGLAVFAITLLTNSCHILGSVLFCFALNYKQMELYHALPFFLYLLSQCIPKPGQTSFTGFYKLLKLGITVIFTFAIIWLPFLFDINDTVQVLNRLFPVSRGLFEDKVSNFWCSLNVIYKFKSTFNNDEMLRLCTIMTLIGLIPSGADLFLRPNIKKFNLALINSSLSFFLFSFQVHEKSILLVALPVLLHSSNDPFTSFWFSIISTFSMLPLFIKDGLVIALVSLTTFYMVTFKFFFENGMKMEDRNKPNVFLTYFKQFVNLLIAINKAKKRNGNEVFRIIGQHFAKNYQLLKQLMAQSLFIFSLTGCLILGFIAVTFEPPEKYPDLFSLLVSVYSFVHFFAFFIYYNVEQFRIPQSFDCVKIKTS